DAGNAENFFASHEALCRNILKLLSDKLYVKASIQDRPSCKFICLCSLLPREMKGIATFYCLRKGMPASHELQGKRIRKGRLAFFPFLSVFPVVLAATELQNYKENG
ncbi:MAG: hypothetical protein DRI57_16335, partial [Deltaproteobacteria bacterium]